MLAPLADRQRYPAPSILVPATGPSQRGRQPRPEKVVAGGDRHKSLHHSHAGNEPQQPH